MTQTTAQMYRLVKSFDQHMKSAELPCFTSLSVFRHNLHLFKTGRSPVMDDYRQETVGLGRRKHARTPDFTSTRTTRIEGMTLLG